MHDQGQSTLGAMAFKHACANKLSNIATIFSGNADHFRQKRTVFLMQAAFSFLWSCLKANTEEDIMVRMAAYITSTKSRHSPS